MFNTKDFHLEFPLTNRHICFFSFHVCLSFMQSQFRFENESLNVVSDAHERVYIYIYIYIFILKILFSVLDISCTFYCRNHIHGSKDNLSLLVYV